MPASDPSVGTLPRHVAVAEVAKPHGLQGELRLKVYHVESDLLLGRPPVRLRLADGSERSATLTSVRRVPGAMLVRLADVSSREAADALRGASLLVAREQLGEAGDDEFFVCDLEGCQVALAGEPFGTVRTVASYPTCDALVVSRSRGPDLEVPLHGQFVRSVDIDARVIELRTIDGLS